MGEQTLDLPEECWEMIFNLIEHYHFVSLSLVCRRFLAITNRLLSRLVVSDPTLLLLPQLLRRFPRLRIIDLAGFRGDVDALLSQIAKSGLDLEALGVSNQKTLPVDGLRVVGSKMRNLRYLNCSKIGFLQDNDLGLIAESFPFLEELDISYPEHTLSYSSIGLLDSCVSARPITDSGILSLAVKLKGLKKINLSGNHFITDKSLGILSRNCLLLSEILLHNCDFVTQNGILLVIRGCANLNSLSFSGIWSSFVDSRFKDSFVCTKSLCAVDFSDSVISDELLYSIAEACLPLNKLVLSHCQNYTFSGISSLLCKHQSLQYLDLELANFLTDEYMLELSKFLQRITYLNLSLCHQLTNSTFFNLTRNCPLLNEFKMVGTNLGAEDFTTSFVVNPRVKSLNLARNSSLDNDTISMFASSCPNLKFLDLSCCFNITEEGISEVLKRCSEIRYLRIEHCSGIKTLVIDYELSSLEVLCAWESGIDDDGLAMIGNRCCRLLQLDLTGCSNVTVKGVKEVVQNCRVLREINLKWCNNVDVDIIAWMVFSRPSLKRIVPPRGFVPSESQRNLFLRHGCLVCDG
ncbi:uncharacterized protein LOC107409080 [Ziziphus jujuba]|uniref:Uncharacterized protein LOC107409080 n=1 Tax=Ziziphus jujuba TaxID=326968 RepID=A0A6P3Z583_ZIZJJ|nr:uncharacterized protein LOC107409080 [Ziziphus jujuba]